MSEKITGKDLELMLEKFGKDQWTKYVMPSAIKPNTGESEEFNPDRESFITNVSGEEVWDTLSSVAKNTGKLNLKDIKYYEENPDEIDSKVQSYLIAISRLGKAGSAYELGKSIQSLDDSIQSLQGELRSQNDKFKKLKDWGGEKDTSKFKKWAFKTGSRPEPFEYEGKTYTQFNTFKRELLTPTKNSILNLEAKLAKQKQRLKFLNVKGNKDKILALAAAAEKALTAYDNALDKYGEKARQQTLTRPSIKTVPGEAPSSSKVAYFSESEKAIIQRLFGETDDLKERMESVSKFSELYYKAARGDEQSIKAIQQKDMSTFHSEIMLLDIFNSIVKEMDAGAGGYLFEYFLAMTVSGKVLGKEINKAGKMGSSDVYYNLNGSDNWASAKFYKDPAAATQAESGFKDLIDKERPGENPAELNVLYIIAGKRQGVSPTLTKTAGQTSDPAKIIAVEIYAPVVKVSRQSEVYSYKVGDKSLETNGEGDLKIGALRGDAIGTIYLSYSRIKSFKEMLMDKISTNLKNMGSKDEVKSKMIAFIDQYFEGLEQANENAKVYLTQEDREESQATAGKIDKNLRQSRSAFNKMQKTLEPTRPEEVNESQKITAKQLQKLIEENFKK